MIIMIKVYIRSVVCGGGRGGDDGVGFCGDSNYVTNLSIYDGIGGGVGRVCGSNCRKITHLFNLTFFANLAASLTASSVHILYCSG